jgi:hypothetical protein
MAQEQDTTPNSQPRTFDKSLNEDVNDFHLPSNEWTQARNAINNSVTGDLGKLGNEPANLKCVDITNIVIGTIHIITDKWVIFSTDGYGNCEIGLFKEGTCRYDPLVSDPCLSFQLENLVIGVSRSLSTCTYNIYWDDSINPSRVMEINVDYIDTDPTSLDYFNPNLFDSEVNGQYTSTIPWVQTCVDSNGDDAGGCIICTNTPVLDCDKLRLAQYILPICPRVEKGYSGGNLLNGSYMVAMAYSVNGQKMSDWYVSNTQGLFDPNNSSCSLDVFIDSIDQTFDQIIVATVATINQQTVVRQAGLYSTRQKRLSFDTIFDTWPTIPIEQLPIMTPIVNKTDAMYSVGDYLIRVGPTSKENFNYQPLANQIVAKWQSVEYPSDYYHKGGNKTGYMRDEVYAFFIEWIYDTGDTSASYHIPGRPALLFDIPYSSPLITISEIADWIPAPGNNALVGDTMVFETYNTARWTGAPGTPLSDGGVVIAEGIMGYWQSTEYYPDKHPEIWDASFYCWSTLDPSTVIGCTGSVLPPPYVGTPNDDYDLCGKPIRHHKFPEDIVSGDPSGSATLFNSGSGSTIRVMGVAFENIRAPRTNDGQLIPGIIGYRILRSTRNGNKTVIAKGIINNMREYNIPGSSKNGLMPNYPYNDLRADTYLSTTLPKTDPTNDSIILYNPMPGGFGGESYFNDKHYTFHSPDTNFSNPFLAAKEFRVYGTVSGNTIGKFDLSEKHPKEKLVTNLSFLIAGIGGIGIAIVAANGKRQTKYINPQTGYSLGGSLLGTGAGIIQAPALLDTAVILASQAANTGGDIAALVADLGILGTTLSGQSNNSLRTIIQSVVDSLAVGSPFTKPADVTNSNGYLDDVGNVFGGLAGIPLFLNYFSDGTDSILRLMKALIRYRDFAVRYHSYGYYNNITGRIPGDLFRNELVNQQYLNPEILDLNGNYKINNLFRVRTVHFESALAYGSPAILDDSRFTGSDAQSGLANNQKTIDNLLNTEYIRTCSSLYGALKVRIRNQYSQLNNIVQLPTSPCYTRVYIDNDGNFLDPNGINLPTPYSSTETLFGGDVYINKYTEKNTFFFFYDWLDGQPDGAQLDYSQHIMVPYPHYWANFNEFQTSDFTTSMWGIVTNPSTLSGGLSSVKLPSSYYALDGGTHASVNFPLTDANALDFRFDKRGWFYLFNSGVRNFFVESEINVAYRDQGNLDSQKFYDPYSGSDTKTLFNTAIIKAGNYYKYDISLSVTKLFKNYTSWATMQASTYNPYIAETCFVYIPTRVIYSLPAQYEGLKDAWKVFLANNYYDFDNVVTCIKPINKSGAIIFFDAASPVQFQGTDQLETGLGTKLTIGDGGLFSQPLQALINVDSSHEYGSCQNRMSVINTPAGIYWISQNQGKIFTVAGQGIKEVSNINLKWWFNQYLPYQLIDDYPNFQLLDNPVIGLSCQSVYDNENGLLYFTKKDYSLKKDLASKPVYIGGNKFLVDDMLNIQLGNPNDIYWPLYFDEASWTISFDPKTQGWLSYHDWHPNFCLPGKNTFMTVSPLDGKSIWIHNERFDLYCNYYGEDKPFEVEFQVSTGQEITSLRSIQYYLECYKYSPNGYDRFHVLDYNFDEATIYNTEQTSGLLKLILNPKENPTAILTYPIINPTNINVLFSKEENKYRFNQFWDITEDRGEYFNALIPGFAERPIWDTASNGYVRVLNSFNLNYNKDPFQRKKFRHYKVTVLLRKLVSGNRKMLVMLAETKNLLSPR